LLIVTRSLSVANFFGNKEQKEKDNFFLRTDLSEKCINGLSEPDRGGMKVKKILFFDKKKRTFMPFEHVSIPAEKFPNNFFIRSLFFVAFFGSMCFFAKIKFGTSEQMVFALIV
jgi:hypothetical protein